MSIRTGKLLISAIMCLLVAAAAYVSALIVSQQKQLNGVARYNIAWVANRAVNEYLRLEQRVDAVDKQSEVDAEEVQLRLDIVESRVKVLSDGDFYDFASRDAANIDAINSLRDTIEKIRPLVGEITQPGNIAKVLAILRPLDRKLEQLAASAYRFSGERVAEDQSKLIELHWQFSEIAVGLFLCGFLLLGLLALQNRLLARAQTQSNVLASGLRDAAAGLERANRRFDVALNNMSQGLCMVSKSGSLLVANHKFSKLFGIRGELTPGNNFNELEKHCSSEALRVIIARQESIDSQDRVDFVEEFEGGHTISVSHQPMTDGGWVATYEDISQRRWAEARISYLAHHDSLTGLVNRTYFHDRLEPALVEASSGGTAACIFYLDLDGFKDVNNSFGHPVGDALLRDVGTRLRAWAREADLVSRLGGDEFGILLIGIHGREQCAAMAVRLIEQVSMPYSIDGLSVAISISVGISIGPEDGSTADELIKNADLALYRAKSEGKRTYRFFDPEMDRERRARRALDTELRSAVIDEEFEVHFQPIVAVKELQITGFETLLRWNRPGHGNVSPGIFIPIAEENGTIEAIGEWVLRKACAQATTWPCTMYVSVNLSPIQFRSGNLLGVVRKALAESGLSAERLELEITETALLNETESTVATLHELRALGIRVALDDFGTGYSSLSYLRSFPFDKIKIDQSFVREVTTRPDCVKIVRLIASLGASLGMTTTAEGVETARQLEQITAAGCDEAQGYFFGRPAPADKLRFLLGEISNAAVAAE